MKKTLANSNEKEVACKSSALPVIDSTPIDDPTQFEPEAGQIVDRSKSKREIAIAANLLEEFVKINRIFVYFSKIDWSENQVVSEYWMSKFYNQDSTSTPNKIIDLENAISGKGEQILEPENSGLWSDFELGMIHGKLSALRWVLGDGCDNLNI